MKKLLPEVKKACWFSENTGIFNGFEIECLMNYDADLATLFELRMWNFVFLGPSERCMRITVKDLEVSDNELFLSQGYILTVEKQLVTIQCHTKVGFLYAISTLKQLMNIEETGYWLECVEITDWPDVAHRSLSTTFTWYAGYGRIGFDMQLWGFERWKEFLNICCDYKINQLNMCLYGYWPFEVKGYPEASYRNVPLKIWDAENEEWLTVSFTHPNLQCEFLKELIDYGHRLGIKFFAYMGLNSYSGGYANAHKDKRMKRPENSPFINDFDSLCLSEESTIEYLKACMKAVVDQGFDGIDFEESEEAYWYCNCDRCKEHFWAGNETPEQTLHSANTYLLNILYNELKRIKPDIIIGLRAWRQPPLVRDDNLMKSMAESIPKDVVLFWAPGQYVPDSEFDKWIKYFGKDRIWARDAEAIGVAACFGRLIRPFRFNGIRTEEEPISQYVEEDIRQHKGSAKRHVAGINGYLFEWYGFFMAFFAHANYGWGSNEEVDDFLNNSLGAVFGDELGQKILFVMKHMLIIHDSQLKIFDIKFPFAEIKVERQDIPRIQRAIADYPEVMRLLDEIDEAIKYDPRTKIFKLHFVKWKVCEERSRIMYDLALASINYDEAENEEDKKKYLEEMLQLNDREFEVIRKNYLDVNPIEETGLQLCMIPNHELRRVILNKLKPEQANPNKIFLDVASLGWLWL